MTTLEDFLSSLTSLRAILEMNTLTTSPTILLSNSSQKETVELIIHNNEHSSEAKSKLLVARASKYISVIRALSDPYRCLPQGKSQVNPRVDEPSSVYKSKDTTQKGTPDNKSPNVALIAVKKRGTDQNQSKLEPKDMQSLKAQQSLMSQDKAFSSITIHVNGKQNKDKKSTVSKSKDRSITYQSITNQSPHKSHLSSQLNTKTYRNAKNETNNDRSNDRSNERSSERNGVGRPAGKPGGKPAGKPGGKPVEKAVYQIGQNKADESKVISIDLTSNITWQTMHYTRNFESMLKRVKK